jgi:prepilin-type N-terminal cleavage/methylation domain-containing protein
MLESRLRQTRIKTFQGLSLIEVCVAIAILAIILVSLSGIFNQGYRFLRKTRMNYFACFLAQEQMENLTHQYIFPLLDADRGCFNRTVTSLGGPSQNFTRQVNISYPATVGSVPAVRANLAEINVTVSWRGQTGVQNFTLVSLVANMTH